MLAADLSHTDLDPAPFRRALVAAGLGILLFGWPHYAANRTPETQHRLAQRLNHLTAHRL